MVGLEQKRVDQIAGDIPEKAWIRMSIADRSTRDLAIETTVVLAVCFVPSLFSSLASVYLLPVRRSSSGLYLYQSLYDIVHDSAQLVLLLYLIFRSGELLSNFGIKRFRILPDFFGGIGIYLLARLCTYLLWIVVAFLEQHSLMHLSRYRYNPFSPPSGDGAYEILVLRCALIGMTEEMIFRAYLIHRFEKLFESTGLALLFSTVLFGAVHIYQGIHGFLSAIVMGFIIGSLFCLFRRLWPLTLAHAIWDFIALATLK